MKMIKYFDILKELNLNQEENSVIQYIMKNDFMKDDLLENLICLYGKVI